MSPDRRFAPLSLPLRMRPVPGARRLDIHRTVRGACARARSARVVVPERLARHLPDFHECIEQRGHDERLLQLPLRVLHGSLNFVAAQALRPERCLRDLACLLLVPEGIAQPCAVADVVTRREAEGGR